MDIGFFFSFEGTVIQLPYNPEKITVRRDSSNKTEEVLALGDINILKDAKLRELSFDCFFPYDTWFPWIRTYGDFKKPAFYRDFFDNAKNKKKPVRLIVTGPIDINMLVSVEMFEYTYQAGDFEDMYYSLSLKEYRNHSIIKIDPETGLPLSSENAGALTTENSIITPAEITIDSPVYVTGTTTWYSDGQGPLYEYNKYPCKVNYIEKGEVCPYSLFDEAQAKIIGWAKKEMLVLR